MVYCAQLCLAAACGLISSSLSVSVSVSDSVSSSSSLTSSLLPLDDLALTGCIWVTEVWLEGGIDGICWFEKLVALKNIKTKFVAVILKCNKRCLPWMRAGISLLCSCRSRGRAVRNILWFGTEVRYEAWRLLLHRFWLSWNGELFTKNMRRIFYYSTTAKENLVWFGPVWVRYFVIVIRVLALVHFDYSQGSPLVFVELPIAQKSKDLHRD